ncbi:TolC family protein [Colwellia piezophila]|uniref:TolC family protein n=1 Tax=Colwellia piezophila TaxID=211668 RepID=UPI000369103A|nr:TolC family protein [Colwellia piezophila]
MKITLPVFLRALFSIFVPAFLSVMLLFGCAQNNNVVIDNVAQATSFIEEGNSKLDRDWWHSFDNEELSQLVSQGLQDNLSLKAKELRLKSSAINAKIASADLYPSLNLTSNVSSKFDDFGEVNSASFGLSSSWELDLWGGIAANENKAYWNHQEQLALYRARATLVAGSISNAWLGLMSEQEKQRVLADQFQRTQDALKVISRRFAMGKISVTNIWQQQKLLKSIEVLQSKNHADLYIYQQTLALWLSVPTKAFISKQLDIMHSLPSLPQLPKLGVPAQVLKYRPDIEQAFAKIKAADEHLAMAISNQYPRITLRANYSTTKNSVADLFDDWSGNLIASLAMPLFDSGERKSVVEQRELELQALLFDYQQVWLTAIASVNQVLINETQLLKITKNLQEQLDLAERTERLTTIKYLNGKTNYLNLLKAQESILSLERQFIEANKRVMINRVLLYRELSHGDFSPIEQVSSNQAATSKISRKENPVNA